jgi:hypothetical protein
MTAIPVDDPEGQIQAFVEQLRQPDWFLGSVLPFPTAKGAADILNLATIAFKYEFQGMIGAVRICVA